MLKTTMAPASVLLRPYVWAYGTTSGQVDSIPVVVPLPARPKQLLQFSFAERFQILRAGSARGDDSPRVALVGAQSRFRPGLSVLGRVDNFAIHFQPSGFGRLFAIPMTTLTDAAFDAHAVVGPWVSALERELGDTAGFAERIRVAEKHLIRLIEPRDGPDPVALTANALFACHGALGVAAMASRCGLSARQFERRFLAQVGLPPKLYGRIVRFNAALDHKLRLPTHSWARIAADQDYYDQMHLVHDCRAFTGESPSRFLARLGGAPAFNAFYATDRPRQD